MAMTPSEKEARAPEEIEFRGSCECRRMRYTSSATPTNSVICHCITCRKLSGGPYQCYLELGAKDVILYDHVESLRYEGLPAKSIGGIDIKSYSAVGERAFCKDCYTPLAMRYHHEDGIVHVTLASVDTETVKDDHALRPTVHIFASHVPYWDKIPDDAKTVHQRFGNTYEEEMKAYQDKQG